jgi:hypothetical protein
MPAGPSYLYLLQDEMHRSLTWQYGLMGYSSLPSPLIYTPDGWKEISIVDQRDMITWTLDVDFTIPLNFVGDGGQILKTIYSTKGTEEKIYLVILEQRLFYDGSQYYYYYTLFYRSRLDWSTYVHDGPKVSINMLQQDFAISLKNNSSKTYQYKLSDSSLPAPIFFDGIKLRESGNFIVIDGVDIVNPLPTFYDFYIPLSFLNSEGRSAGISFQSQQFEQANPPLNTANWFTESNSQATGPITVHIKTVFSIKVTRDDSGSGELRIRLESNMGQNIQIALFNGVVVGNTYTIPVEMDITVAVGEQFYLAGFIAVNPTGGGQHFGFMFNPGGDFAASFDNRYRSSYIKAFDIQEVFSLLVNSVSGGEFVAAPSTLLQRTGLKLAITSGDGIRGIDGAILKITWKNLWSLANTYEDPGMYLIGNKVYMERKEDCLDPSSIIDLGEVSGFKDSPANDLKFGKLTIGFPNQDYGEANGKDEFNTTLEMGSPITSVSNEVNFISDIRGDGFGMEDIRSGLDGKTTTDNTADGTPFVMHIEDNPSNVTVGVTTTLAFKLDRTLNPYATGLLFPETVFNLALSPKQCLYRKGNYLIGCLYQQETKELTFQNLDKNQALEVRVPGQRPVIEKANEVIGDLGTPYFKPVIFEFTGRSPSDILQRRKANPRALIGLTLQGISFTCIPQKEGIQPSTEAAQAYQVLARPDNDITLLNNYYGD